jgi:hypothetical protein
LSCELLRLLNLAVGLIIEAITNFQSPIHVAPTGAKF